MRAGLFILNPFPAKTGLLRRLAIVARRDLSPYVRAALALLLTAGSLCGHGAYDEELKRTDEQIAANPTDGQHWFRRGFLNVLHGEWQTALVDLERADRLEPGKYATDWLRGQALMAGGKFEAAKSVLDDFLVRFPQHGGALATRARVLSKLELHEAALADFRESLVKTPNPEPDLVIEVAEALVAQQHAQEAADIIGQYLQQNAHSLGLVMKALELELSLGRVDAALSRVDAMQKTAPRPEPWMAKRAAVLTQAGRADDAKAAWMALRDHILALPNLERGSHAMSRILEQAQFALGVIKPAQDQAATSAAIHSNTPLPSP